MKKLQKQKKAHRMTEITAKDVKELRDLTGAGMMDCKKALGEASGDMEKNQRPQRRTVHRILSLEKETIDA